MTLPAANPTRCFVGSCCLLLAMAGASRAQTATRNMGINGGQFSGTLAGDVTANVKLQSTDGNALTYGILHVEDLDVVTISAGGTGNLFPDSISLDNMGAGFIGILPTSVGVNMPTTTFNNPVGGNLGITAGDQRADMIPGVVDGGMPGSDGAWDDPSETGILNDATLDSFNVALNSDINAPATAGGTIAAFIPSDITVPNVVNTSALDVDLVLKNSSFILADIAPTQNLSIKNLTLSSSDPVPLTLPGSNFNEATHPTGTPQLDLSVGGIKLAQTTVTGTLVADIMGTMVGSIDLRADMTLANFINLSVDFDDAINGDLGGGLFPLIQVNQAVNTTLELPFLVTVEHEPTADVDFDDVVAALRSGSFGTLPFSLSQQDMIVNLPVTSFELFDQFYQVDEGFFAKGTVWLPHLKVNLGGQLVVDLAADFEFSADLLAEALSANAINVVPEPSGFLLFGSASTGLATLAFRARQSRGRKS